MKDYLKTNLNRKLCSHLVYIKNEVTKQFGTGVLIETKGRRFLLTAQHVIENVSASDLYINLGIPYASNISKKSILYQDKGIDFAFIELDKFETDVMRDKIEPYVISRIGVLGQQPQFDRAAFTGYPVAYQEPDRDYPTRFAWTIFDVIPTAFEYWPDEAKAIAAEGNLDPERNYILDFDQTRTPGYVNHEGRTVTITELMNIGGMSGGPLWVVNRSSSDNPNPEYALYGILVQYWKKAKVWQFVRADTILSILKEKGILEI